MTLSTMERQSLTCGWKSGLSFFCCHRRSRIVGEMKSSIVISTRRFWSAGACSRFFDVEPSDSRVRNETFALLAQFVPFVQPWATCIESASKSCIGSKYLSQYRLRVQEISRLGKNKSIAESSGAVRHRVSKPWLACSRARIDSSQIPEAMCSLLIC